MAPAPDYTVTLAKGLDNLKKQRRLCDITIKVGKRSFEAHKAVLAADSNYFLDMFTHRFKESAENKVNIDGCPEIFKVLLDFVYTGKMGITIQTASEVLEMACYMQLTAATDECAKFITSQFDLSLKAEFGSYQRDEEAIAKHKIAVCDAFKICQLASHQDTPGLNQLMKESAKYLNAYFQELKSSELVLESASYEFLEQFLRQGELSSDEKEVGVIVTELKLFDIF